MYYKMETVLYKYVIALKMVSCNTGVILDCHDKEETEPEAELCSVCMTEVCAVSVCGHLDLNTRACWAVMGVLLLCICV